MSTFAPRALLSLVMAMITLASPRSAAGQLVSKRPASVSLTVFVPPRSLENQGLATEGSVSLVRTSPGAVDLETAVGLLNRPAARVEVRLGGAWTQDSAHVLVQNRRGEFELLARNASVIAHDGPTLFATPVSPLKLRVESSRPLDGTELLIPLEYRLTVGTGDEFSVWTFPSVLRVGPTSGTRPATR
jgi:hypothetical protein